MCLLFCCFFFKQKTAYEMRISDWSSDVCSSDLTKRLDLAEGILADGGIEHKHHVVRCGRIKLAEHTLHLGKLVHQSLLVLQPPEIGRASCRERVCQYV